MERIGFDQLQLASELLPELFQCRDAAAVAPDSGDRSASIQQCPSEPAWPGPDLIDPLTLEVAGHRGDPREELPIENEILAERLACAEAVAGNDRAQRLRFPAQGASA